MTLQSDLYYMKKTGEDLDEALSWIGIATRLADSTTEFDRELEFVRFFERLERVVDELKELKLFTEEIIGSIKEAH